jgi:hypothetical protein
MLSGTDDDLFFHDAGAPPVARMPVPVRAVVSLDPDATRTARRGTDDFPFMHHTSGNSQGDQRGESDE